MLSSTGTSIEEYVFWKTSELIDDWSLRRPEVDISCWENKDENKQNEEVWWYDSETNI